MIALRNVLLSINGGCFLLLVFEILKGPHELEWLPPVIAIYFVVDFFYLSLSYPRGSISQTIGSIE